jgi:hypothetical protein
MPSMMRDLITAPLCDLAAIRAASAFGWGWDAWELPDDDELLD